MSQHLQRAPEFAPGIWLNIDHPLALAELRGRALVVNFWNYTALACLRTLPVVRAWAQRYTDHGLTVIGVLTPEYAFQRERTQVELAVRELGIDYPVLLDRDFRTWNAYGSRFLPTFGLIDQHGILRAVTDGEGGLGSFERAIQAALREINPNADLPPTLREEIPPAEALPPTPDLHGGFIDGALGNPEGYAGSAPVLYGLPQRRADDRFYVSGAWQASDEYLAYRGTTEGIVQLGYEAVEVNAVLSPHYDAVERMLHPEAVTVELWQDDLPLAEAQLGGDVTADGRVLVDRPRLYRLIRNPGFERHELTLRVHARGFALYSFTFVGGARRKAMNG